MSRQPRQHRRIGRAIDNPVNGRKSIEIRPQTQIAADKRNTQPPQLFNIGFRTPPGKIIHTINIALLWRCCFQELRNFTSNEATNTRYEHSHSSLFVSTNGSVLYLLASCRTLFASASINVGRVQIRITFFIHVLVAVIRKHLQPSHIFYAFQRILGHACFKEPLHRRLLIILRFRNQSDTRLTPVCLDCQPDCRGRHDKCRYGIRIQAFPE